MSIDSFIEYLRAEKRSSVHTVEGYERDLLQFRDYLGGLEDGLEPERADADMIRGWLASLMEEGMQPSSVNRKLSSLKSFYRYLLRVSLIDKDPAHLIAGPRKGKRLPVFVRDADMRRLFSFLEDERDGLDGWRNYIVIALFYETGMRCSELVNLHDADVDFCNRFIKVDGKRGKQRLIPVGDRLLADLKSYVAVRNEALHAAECARFVVSDRNEPLSREKIYNLVKTQLRRVVVLKKCSPHVLRHSFATAMLNNGADLESVKELLGHESVSTTQIYTHVTFEELKKEYKLSHPRS